MAKAEPKAIVEVMDAAVTGNETIAVIVTMAIATIETILVDKVVTMLKANVASAHESIIVLKAIVVAEKVAETVAKVVFKAFDKLDVVTLVKAVDDWAMLADDG